MKTTKKNIKIFRCDNSGINKTLEENCMKSFEEIKFEFTSPGTPQKNGVVEWVFDTIYYRMSAMITHEGLCEKLKTDLWPECAVTATKVGNIMVNPHEKTMRT